MTSKPPASYVYVFVRQDIPINHQIVQTNHSTLSMASHYGVEGIPNLVLIGLPDVAALREASELLSINQIPHWDWHEPDFNFGFTSISTAPIAGDTRLCLAHYDLWKPITHPSLSGRAANSKFAHVGSTPAG